MSSDKATIEHLRRQVKAIELASSDGNACASEEQANPFHPITGEHDEALGGFDGGVAEQESQAKSIRWSAMELLSRREHSAKELRAKLIKRYPEESEEIEHCLRRLQDEQLQSDQRYCEAYVAMRQRKCYGPSRILSELREKGVAESVSKAVVFSDERDWYSTAMDAWQRKFRGVYPSDIKDKARQFRFMSYRGFTQDHIHEIFK